MSDVPQCVMCGEKCRSVPIRYGSLAGRQMTTYWCVAATRPRPPASRRVSSGVAGPPERVLRSRYRGGFADFTFRVL